MAEIVDSDTMQWHEPRGGHRDEGVEFKPFFTGEEGEANNYWFTLVQVRERYHTPPHRHMFDQVRFMIKGGFNFGPQEQEEGTVGYFTEGTTYEQSGNGYSYHLLLQCEGGSRTLFFSGRSMRGATEALKESGEFSKGRYRYADGREVDGYEAIYKHLTGALPDYITPRYERPVIIDPAAFQWIEVEGCSGARRRALGVFNERELGLEMLAIDAGGAVEIGGSQGGLLAYVVSGAGMVGTRGWKEGCGLRVLPGESVILTGTESSELFVIAMPHP